MSVEEHSSDVDKGDRKSTAPGSLRPRTTKEWLSKMDNIRAFLHPRISLLTSLRWVPALLFLAALVTVTLVACGGGSSEQPLNEAVAVMAGTPESTEGVQIQKGQEVTVEEYAEAMEEIVAAREERIEAAAEGVLFGALFSRDELERIGSLETSESWSDEDVEFTSDFAETILRALTGLYGDFFTITRDSLDEISSLKPPEHLSDLHGDYVAASREILPLVQDFLEGVQDVDTDIGNREELANFMAALDSGPSDVEDLEERAEGACLELEGQLEAQLERTVSICDPDAAGATSAEPVFEPAPTAAAAVPEPTVTPTRELIPAPDATSAETDRDALIALFNATDGPNWTNNDNWLSDEPIGQWYGVETDSGRVVGVALSDNGLNGEIPPKLGQLSNLEYLELENNQLSGNIPPELGRISFLFLLVLHSNDLSGEIPAELGQLSDLAWLDLYTNQLSGNIPPELGRLSYLEGLVLNDNRLSGDIPAELGQLSNLQHLRLDMNNLTGTIPAELGQLSNLDYLDLSDNDLTGEIPAELGQLSLLTGLYVARNELGGCVPGALGNVDENDLGELGLPSC